MWKPASNVEELEVDSSLKAEAAALAGDVRRGLCAMGRHENRGHTVR
jgi:hypothetical protein